MKENYIMIGETKKQIAIDSMSGFITGALHYLDRQAEEGKITEFGKGMQQAYRDMIQFLIKIEEATK